MKKFFVFLLSMVLLFEQVGPSKVNAEPTELCCDLIHFLDYSCNDRDNIYEFSIDDLQDELSNYDENDFNEDDRSFANEAIRAYHEALDVFIDASNRYIPNYVENSTYINEGVDEYLENPEICERQAQAIHEYLFEGMSEPTIGITTSGIPDDLTNESEPTIDNLTDDSNLTIGITNSFDQANNFVFSEDFKSENKEVFTRYLSILFAYDEEWISQNSHLVLIFLARAFFNGYDDGAKFFYIYTDDDDYKVTHADILLFDGEQNIEIDSLDCGL